MHFHCLYYSLLYIYSDETYDLGVDRGLHNLTTVMNYYVVPKIWVTSL